MKRFARVLLNILVLAAIVVVIMMAARQRGDHRDVGMGGSGPSAEIAAAGKSGAAGRTAAKPRTVISGTAADASPTPVVSTTPLPDDGAPLAEHFDELVERARAGEVVAARRLYQDVSSCRIQLGNTAVTQGRGPPKRSAGETEAQFRQWLPQWRNAELRECARARQCNGVSATQLDRPDQWLLRAAELGDQRAQVSFAQGEVFTRAQSWDSYELLDRWRQQALAWLEHAVANGDAGALLALGSALSVTREQSRIPLLAQIAPDDPARGYAFLYALSLSASVGGNTGVQSALAAAGERLDVTQRLRARTVGTDLYRQHRRTLDSATPDLLKPLIYNTLPSDDADLAARAPDCAARVEVLYQQVLRDAPAVNQTSP